MYIYNVSLLFVAISSFSVLLTYYTFLIHSFIKYAIPITI